MSLVDPVADALIAMKNSDVVAKRECAYRPATKLIEYHDGQRQARRLQCQQPTIQR